MTTLDLIEKLTQLASEPDPGELADTAFFGEYSGLAGRIRDGMEALMFLAHIEKIGWELNHGCRCDVDFNMYSVEAIDNSGGMRAERQVSVQAHTAQGALASAILAICHARVGISSSDQAEPLRAALKGLLAKYDFGDDLPSDHPIVAARLAVQDGH